MMTEYFTLDPAYENYARGNIKLAFRTVYNESYLGSLHSSGFVVSASILGIVVIALLARGISISRIRGEIGILVAGIVIVVGLIIYALISVWLHFRVIRIKLEHLQKSGCLIDGTLISCTLETKPVYWRGDTEKKYLRATYKFSTLDQHHLHGVQIRMLDEAWGKIPSPPGTPVHYKWMRELDANQAKNVQLPTRGTPIRVLYANSETYVML